MAVRTRQRWQTRVEADFSQGIFRDVDRTSIPPGGVYNAVDFLLHRPGKAFKRGGWSYASNALGSDAYAMTCCYANFLVGPQLVAVGAPTSIATPGHLYKIDSSGTVVDMGGSIPYMVERPKLFLGGAQSILVFCGLGSTYPIYYDGANIPQLFAGSPTNITTGAPVVGQYTLTITGTPTGGSFKLDLTASADPPAGGGTGLDSAIGFRTAGIAYNASAANVKTAIDAAIAPLGLTCTSSGGSLPGTPVTIVMPLGVSIAYVPAAISGVSLTGGTAPNGAITNSTSGAATTTDPISVPKGRFCESHLERLVLANSVDNQNRIWFSPLLDVTHTGWDLANAWIDVDENVSGLASLSGQLLVFSANGMWRLTGQVPPPDSDMLLEPISRIGCTDARSIITYNGQCIFANPKGVYVTTGVAPVSLMEDRVETYWQSLFANYTPSADNSAEWCITTGLYGGRFLFVSVLNASGTFVDALVCDMPRRAWTRLSNVKARNFSSSYATQEELYFASRATNRVVKVSGVFSPAAGNKADADSVAIAPVLETRPLGVGIGLKAFGDAEIQYDMRDAASDNPTLAVTTAPGVEAPTFTAVTESPIAETTDFYRKRVTVSKDSECVSLRFTQSGNSSKTELFGVEWTERVYSPFAEGQ